MKNYKKISIDKFKISLDNFNKIINTYLNEKYNDINFINIFNYNISKIFDEFIKTYNRSPYKKKSAYKYDFKNNQFDYF